MKEKERKRLVEGLWTSYSGRGWSPEVEGVPTGVWKEMLAVGWVRKEERGIRANQTLNALYVVFAKLCITPYIFKFSTSAPGCTCNMRGSTSPYNFA